MKIICHTIFTGPFAGKSIWNLPSLSTEEAHSIKDPLSLNHLSNARY